MKRIFLVAVAMMMVFMMAGGAYAAGAAQVGVTANVQAKCISGSDGFFTAFNLDPDNIYTNLTTSNNGTSPTVKCTKGSVVTVTCSPTVGATGVLQMIGDTGGDITYTVTKCDTGWTATGFGSPNAIDVGIEIAASAAANSAAGAHTGTITLTTNY